MNAESFEVRGEFQRLEGLETPCVQVGNEEKAAKKKKARPTGREIACQIILEQVSDRGEQGELFRLMTHPAPRANLSRTDTQTVRAPHSQGTGCATSREVGKRPMASGVVMFMFELIDPLKSKPAKAEKRITRSTPVPSRKFSHQNELKRSQNGTLCRGETTLSPET